jgi:carbonic anhydrase
LSRVSTSSIQTFLDLKRLFLKKLSDTQKPFALFITCSDSRIDPNLLTQTDPGILFSIRNPGNLVPKYGQGNGSEAAAIEYAIKGLGIEEIIICGHTNCGAMKAVLNSETSDTLPCMAEWVSQASNICDITKEHYPHHQDDDLITVAAEENVLQQVNNLKTHPSVLKAINEGKLRIHAWIYHLATGNVYGFDSKMEDFVLLTISNVS